MPGSLCDNASWSESLPDRRFGGSVTISRGVYGDATGARAGRSVPGSIRWDNPSRFGVNSVPFLLGRAGRQMLAGQSGLFETSWP